MTAAAPEPAGVSAPLAGAPIRAALLVGHSHAGKTPLGELLARELAEPGRRCLHLDFGEQLRATVAGRLDPGLTAEEAEYLRAVMAGRLLDDAHFGIAAKVVAATLAAAGFDAARDLLLLTGMPRHVGQARACVGAGLDVRLVVFLDCTAEVALARKRLADAGQGHEDRTHRDDGALAVFARKVASFDAETRPLLGHYRDAGVEVVRVPVEVDTTPARMVAAGALVAAGRRAWGQG